MTNTIKSIRSTLNFFLAMLELSISIILAIKIFQTEVVSLDGLVGCILDFFKITNDGISWLFRDTQFDGAVGFLLGVLAFMIFSQALILTFSEAMDGERKKRVQGNSNFKYYSKKRFHKNRFLNK